MKKKVLGKVIVAKNLSIFLKDIEPIIRDPAKLLCGREVTNFPMRPREAVALFLLCAVFNEISDEVWYVTTDPQYGDGSLAFKRDGTYYAGFLTEQTSVTNFQPGDITNRIIDVVKSKENKGLEYGKSRNLVVFLDKAGEIDHRRIQEYLRNSSVFQSYWLIGLIDAENGQYKYFVSALKSNQDRLFAYEVKTTPSFDAWKVKIIRSLEG